MEITKWINAAKETSFSVLSNTSGVVGAGVGYIQASIGRASIFGSLESSALYDENKTDERHYFLIPDRRNDTGYSLYVLRCLPQDVPPINDLPKRRVFHLPNEHALPTVKHILLDDARELVAQSQSNEATTALSDRIQDIADQIDKIEGRMFSGVLLVGGLVALVNPVAGALVAAKALIPSIGMLLSKHGLKCAGDAAKSIEVSSKIKAAEKDVLKQFKGSATEQIVNPLLQQFERALNTTEEEYDPLMEFDASQLSFGQRDRERILKLTCQALANTYEKLLQEPRMLSQVDIGPEDLRFLQLVTELAKQ